MNPGQGMVVLSTGIVRAHLLQESEGVGRGAVSMMPMGVAGFGCRAAWVRGGCLGRERTSGRGRELGN